MPLIVDQSIEIDRIVSVCNYLFVNIQLSSSDIEIKRFEKGFVSSIYHVLFKNSIEDQTKSVDDQNDLNEEDRQLFCSGSVVVKFFPVDQNLFDILSSQINSIIAGIAYQHSIGPKVLLVNEDTIVIGFIKGRPAVSEDDYNENFQKLFAYKLAQFHSIDVPLQKNDYKQRIVHVCDQWITDSVIYSLYNDGGEIREILLKNNCPNLLSGNYREELRFVRDSILSSGYPIAFTHGDINHSNILILDEKVMDEEVNDGGSSIVDPIRFVDFDYSGYQYRGMDFGRYFANCKQSCLFSEEPVIDDEEMSRFISYYLEESSRIYGDSYREQEQNSTEHILKEAKLFILYAYLIDINFGLSFGDRDQTIQEEFIMNADKRFSGYLNVKQRFQIEDSTLPPIIEFELAETEETAAPSMKIDSISKKRESIDQSEIELISYYCNQLFVDLRIDGSDIEIRHFENGFVSQIYLVSFKNSFEEQLSKSSLNKSIINLQDRQLFETGSVVVKLFPKSENIPFDTLQSKIISTIVGIGSKNGQNIGPKVLLVKHEVIVMSFILGRLATFKDDSTETFCRLLASKMAQFHSLQVSVPKNMYKSKIVSMMDEWIGETELNMIYSDSGVIRNVLIENNCDALLGANYSEELKFIKDCVLTSNYPIAFEHNDMTHANIIIHQMEQNEDIRFIDFDFSSYFYRARDLGRYFANCKQSQMFSDEPVISDEQMVQFIKHYIEESCRIHGEQFREQRNNSPEHLLKEAKLFVLLSYIIDINFNIWYSNIETDRRKEFVINADRRFAGYLNVKRRFQSEQSLPDGFN